MYISIICNDGAITGTTVTVWGMDVVKSKAKTSNFLLT